MTATTCFPDVDFEYAATNELKISGKGFFVVRDPATFHCYATQAGKFSVDAEGYLVTETGARLQGWLGGNQSKVGDLRIGGATVPAETLVQFGLLYYGIDKQGRIMAHMNDGSSFLCGQILLQNFERPRALVNEGGHLFSHLEEAGPLPRPAAPGSNGLGIIRTNMLEFSRAAGPNWRN